MYIIIMYMYFVIMYIIIMYMNYSPVPYTGKKFDINQKCDKVNQYIY